MSFERRLRFVRSIVLLMAALCVTASLAEAQTGRILKDAPLRLYPDLLRKPILMMEPGVLVQVTGREGTWLIVTVDGGQLGRRSGYVEAQFIEIVQAATLQPKPLQESQTPVTAASRPTATARTIGTTETFQKSKLNVTVEDKTRAFDVIVRYEPDALVIVEDKKNGQTSKSFPYATIKGAEYSYAKSPRWKSAIFVSPFFLFTSGKKHWFLIQGAGDYALLQLDKNNYRLIVAAFEARTGLKVETVGEK